MLVIVCAFPVFAADLDTPVDDDPPVDYATLYNYEARITKKRYKRHLSRLCPGEKPNESVDHYGIAAEKREHVHHDPDVGEDRNGHQSVRHALEDSQRRLYLPAEGDVCRWFR